MQNSIKNSKSLMDIENAGFYFEQNKYLFKNLNFNIKRGETIAILGLNGQGKSTLMFCMMGILKFKEGKIKTNAKFAFLPQSFSVVFDYSVLDVVTMGRIREISLFSKPSKKDIEICKNSLNMLGIYHLANRNFNALSGGQKQLVLFARALCAKGDILFLDEPASSLDLRNQDKILTLIENLKLQNDISIVFTTHDPSHAISVSTKTLILRNDLGYEFGDSKNILKDDTLSKLYNIDIKTVEFKLADRKIPTITQIFSIQKQI